MEFGAKKCVLVCFSVNSNRFESVSERNNFFKQLYGWNQKIVKKKKTYIYRRNGLLDNVPHIKIDQSSFIIPEEEFNKVFNFFEQWSKKVIWKTFKILLEEKESEEFFR
jgi:hypothetical protein